MATDNFARFMALQALNNIESMLNHSNEIVPPLRFYSMAGLTNEWFLKNTLFENAENYYIRFDDNVTAHYNANFDKRHTFVLPTKETKGGGIVKYKLESLNDKNLSKNFEISYLRASTSGLAQKTIKALFIGDSLIDNSFTVTELKKLFDEDKSGAGIELYGTRGTAPYNHEGHVGWSSYDILNNVSYNNINNAFINPSTGVFDFEYYSTNNDIPILDWIVIQIGVNDIFRPMEKTTTVENIQIMIDSIRKYMPDTKIIVATPPQPYLGSKYDCLNFRPAEYAHQFRLQAAKDIINTFGKNVSKTKIYVASIHSVVDSVVDTDYDFNMSSRKINSDSDITEQYCTDITHYALSGHKKVARQYYCLMKYVE